MGEAGYGPNARLAFDLAAVGFDRAFARMREETVEQPAPRERTRRPTVRVPRYSEAELLAVLGIDPADAETYGATAHLTQPMPLDAALLDQLDWDEETDDG